MKSIKFVLPALAALALAPSAAADPATGTDRANAARACKTLAATAPQDFAAQYGTAANAHGKCVSAWAAAAHQARHAARVACAAAGPRGKGNAYGRCVANRTNSLLNGQVRATQNAAQTCRTLRASMGAAEFARAYGTNPNNANAFGKCVSSMRSQGANAGRRTATLTGATGSGTFAAVINVKQGRLCYTLAVTGLTDVTGAHIHVKPSGAIVVPLETPTAGSSSGCVTGIDAALLRAILQTPSTYYVNVHTVAAPAGAISGDLVK